MTDTLKIAIVGTGSRGTLCFGKLLSESKDAKIAALCDLNLVRAKHAAELLGIDVPIYQNLDDMAAGEKLDAVIITTPDYTHAELTEKALLNNWNVLVDKPLATNVADCKRVIALAEKSDLTLMMGFNLRHHAVLKKLKSLIDDGVLGKVFLVENREFYNGGRTYMSRWNRLCSNTGSLWIHKGSHDFDIFNWLLGFPEVKRVSAFAAVNVLTPENLPFELSPGIEPGPCCSKCAYFDQCPDHFEIYEKERSLWQDDAIAVDGYMKDRCMYLSDKDTHDNGVAMIEYADGVKACHLECFIGSCDDRLYTIAGDRATVTASLGKRTIVITPRWEKGEPTTIQLSESDGGHGGADPVLLKTFLNTLRGEGTANSTAYHGMLASAIGQAAEISRREHRMVEISELL